MRIALFVPVVAVVFLSHPADAAKRELSASGWAIREESLYALPGLGNDESIEETFTAPGGRRIAYLVSRRQSALEIKLIAKMRLAYVIDGGSTPWYESTLKEGFAFSPDGRRWAYAAKQQDRWTVVVDSVPGPALVRLPTSGPLFSGDGRHVAYVGSEGGPPRAYLDHVAQAGTDSALGVAVSADGARLACSVARGDFAWVVVDGVRGPVFKSLAYYSVGVSPNGKHVGYVAASADGVVPVLDQVAWAAAEDAVGPIFGAAGERVAFAVKRQGQWMIEEPTGAGPAFDAIADGGTMFSPDGAHIAFAGKRGGRWTVLVDGTAGPEFDRALAPVFSADGRRVAYQAKRGERWLAVVDGVAGVEHESMAEHGLVFSPDGGHVAYLAREGKQWQVVLDGQAGPFHQHVLGPPSFSPSGAHSAYGAKDKGKWSMLVDGLPLDARFDAIVEGAPTWIDESTIEFLAFRNRKVYRVQAVRTGE